MAEPEDDIGDVVDAIDRLTTVEKLGNVAQGLTALHQIQQARQAAKSREQAQQAEAARAERIYLGAHCPLCHTSLTGTPAVCAACTRDIVWLRLPLDAAVLELISSNLHTFKEVYRDLLGASVLFDQKQKLAHVPLSSQQEIGKAKEKLRPLDEKLTNYINYFCHVVERRTAVIAQCSHCQGEMFERVFVPQKGGNTCICPPCVTGRHTVAGLSSTKLGCLGIVLLWVGVIVATEYGFFGGSPPTEMLLVLVGIVWAIWRWNRTSARNDILRLQRAEFVSDAAIPTEALSLEATTMDGLIEHLNLRTKQLEVLLQRIDSASSAKRITSDSGGAALEYANQFESVAQDSASPILLPSQTPLRHIAASRFAIEAAEAEFTALEKQKPLTADSPMIRAVALAMVAMKIVDIATVRTCTDRLARKLIEITPEELLKSVKIVGRGVQEAKLQYAFEQVCDSLRAEPESAKARHRVVAEVIAELLPKDTGETAKNATGPKVIRALCKVLNS